MYETNTRSNIIRHIRTCEENTEYEEDSIEDMFIEYDYSVLDHIENEEAAISVIKDFINSNELSEKSELSFEEITAYIVQKLHEKKKSITTTYNHELNIYEFFFGESDIVKQKFIERMKTRLR
jgi:hypothetical protein